MLNELIIIGALILKLYIQIMYIQMASSNLLIGLQGLFFAGNLYGLKLNRSLILEGIIAGWMFNFFTIFICFL